jgi:hypothetical protein
VVAAIEWIRGCKLAAFSYEGHCKTSDELDSNGETFDDLSDRKVRTYNALACVYMKGPDNN